MVRNPARRDAPPAARATAGARAALAFVAVACSAVAHPAFAQTAGPTLGVTGVIYDSVAQRPIAGAIVEFVNADDPTARPFTALSDSAGRYAVQGLSRGVYFAGFFHPALDTLGLEIAARRIAVGEPAQRIDLATPSARTVMTSLCPPGSGSDSTGLLIGHVRSTAEQAPVAGASIVVEWNETVIDAQGIGERARRVTARAEEPGWFAMCGVPSDAVLQARAFSGPDSSGYVEVEVPPHGLRHVSFFVGEASLVSLPAPDATAGAAAARPDPPELAWRGRARLTGIVVDHRGRPVANAHALVWGTQLDATTNELGAFALDGLPGGTHTLEVRAISHVPATSTVHLAESRPATVNVALARPAQVLADVTVRGSLVYSRNLTEFERRRQSGFGSYRSSREIEQQGPNVRLTQLLREFPNVRVTMGRGGSSVTMQRNATTGGGRESCSPSLYVDGTLDYARDYDFYYAERIAGIEVYREASRPFEFLDQSNACGAIAIWTRPAPAKGTKRN